MVAGAAPSPGSGGPMAGSAGAAAGCAWAAPGDDASGGGVKGLLAGGFRVLVRPWSAGSDHHTPDPVHIAPDPCPLAQIRRPPPLTRLRPPACTLVGPGGAAAGAGERRCCGHGLRRVRLPRRLLLEPPLGGSCVYRRTSSKGSVGLLRLRQHSSDSGARRVGCLAVRGGRR